MRPFAQLRWLSFAACVFVAGCAGTGEAVRPGGTVHRVEGSGAASYANSYWFETQAGPIIVDTPLKAGEAKRLAKGLEMPYRIFITAARPERFATIDILRQGRVFTATTPAVANEIKDYGASRLATARKHGGGDVPSRVSTPNPSIEERTHEVLGEVEVELLPLGPAESASSLAIWLPKTSELITGDVVVNQEHMDLTWGRSVQWQDRINELKALSPKYVYPGHGRSGGPELLDQALEYLKFFHDTVAEHVKPGAPQKVSAADRKAIKKAMLAKYPAYGRTELLDKSIPAEYAVQLQALPPAGAPAGESAPAGAAPTTPAPASANTPAAAPSAPAPAAAPNTPTPASTSAPGDASKSAVDDLLNDAPAPSKKKKKR